MGFLEWAGYASAILALIGVGFGVSRAFDRILVRPMNQLEGLREPSSVLPELNLAWAKPELVHLTIVGYSVHSIYDHVNSLVAYALKQRISVRFLMLDPNSQFLIERAFSESMRTNLTSPEFLARSQHSIRRTAQQLMDSVDTVRYQNNLQDSICELRVYSAPPVYRGLLSNFGCACSSYLEDLERPSRNFLMTDPQVTNAVNEREATRVSNWVQYLVRFRSRPYEVEALLLDLYDTVLDVDEDRQRAHIASLAEDCGMSFVDFSAEWEDTRIRSNSGAFRSTAERFESILDAASTRKEGLAEELAQKEHKYLRETFSLSPAVRGFLVEARARGYKIGLVSNCSVSSLHCIHSSGLATLVDCMSLSFDVGSLKPHPAIYLDALRRLGSIDPSRAIFIGDGANDELEGAKRLGIRPIQAKWFVRRKLAGNAAEASSIGDAGRLIDAEASWCGLH